MNNMESRNYWEENGHGAVNYVNYNSSDGYGRAAGDQLNFAPPSEDEAEYPPGAYLKKGKVSRQDPMSHRIIEKRRRDRMNNCLADLSRLIPPEYLKKGRGRVEKTEIIEMAIRHIKYLQERANAAERQGAGNFRAGFQEAMAEGIRFLVEVQGYGAADGLCSQFATHLQRHIEVVTKGDSQAQARAGAAEAGGGAGALGFARAPSKGAIAQAPPPAPPPFADHYDHGDAYAMDCDRVAAGMAVCIDRESPDSEAVPLDARHKDNSPNLRNVRKTETDEYLHSYKFKNSIERRFSRSQDNESAALAGDSHGAKPYGHKRRRARHSPPPPTSTSASTSTSGAGSTEDARDTSPQDTSSHSHQQHHHYYHHHHYEKPPPTTQSDFVPIFALNSNGKYYVPLTVEPACLRRAGAGAALASRCSPLSPSLHPVIIHVDFQPSYSYPRVKQEHTEHHWRPV